MARIGGQGIQALMRGVEKTSHLFRGFALDAHRQAERTDFKVAHRAVEHLPEQVGSLLTRDRPRALLAAADFLDVLADAHGRIVPEAS